MALTNFVWYHWDIPDTPIRVWQMGGTFTTAAGATEDGIFGNVQADRDYRIIKIKWWFGIESGKTPVEILAQLNTVGTYKVNGNDTIDLWDIHHHAEGILPCQVEHVFPREIRPFWEDGDRLYLGGRAVNGSTAALNTTIMVQIWTLKGGGR